MKKIKDTEYFLPVIFLYSLLSILIVFLTFRPLFIHAQENSGSIMDPGPDPVNVTVGVSYLLKTVYWLDIRDEIFLNNKELYSKFQTCFIEEPYVRVYDWLVTNAEPISLDPPEALRCSDFPNIAPLRLQAQAHEFFYGSESPDMNSLFFLTPIKLSFSDGPDERFPRGIFRGLIQALELTDRLFNPDEDTGSGNFDLRKKALYRFPEQDAFKRTMLVKDESGRWHFLRGGVYHVRGALDLTRFSVDSISYTSLDSLFFDENILVIADEDITLPSIKKTDFAKQASSTATFVSAGGAIILASNEEVAASLVALDPERGTLKKRSTFVNITGSLAVAYLDFEPASAGNIFNAGNFPPLFNPVTGGFMRNEIRYDPALDPTDRENYTKHYYVELSSSTSFWRMTEDEEP